MNDDQRQRKQSPEVNHLSDKGRPSPGSAASLWDATAPKFTGGTHARENFNTDVAVIGAGVAGLSTALHLQEHGIDTLILEAESPGSAATGASGGILAPEFVRDGIAKACRLHGKQQGERLAQMIGESADFTFDLISRYQITCDVQQRGFLSPARSAREIDSLRTDGNAWNSLGFRVEFLDARHTAAAIGSSNYRGALFFESGGALNPLAYANGLANVLQASGVPLFTNSPVERIERDGQGWLIRTPESSVKAKRVVLAANGGNAKLHPSLSSTTLPLLVHEYATSPIPAEDRSRYFGKGIPYTDRQAYVFTARLDGSGRVISALPEVVPKWNTSRFSKEARRRFDSVYGMEPSLRYAWSGTAHLNPSLMPTISLPEDDLSMLAIQACNGRGLGVNTILGSEVAKLLAGGDRDAIAVPLSRPKSVSLHSCASRMPRIIMSAAQIKDRWFR